MGIGIFEILTILVLLMFIGASVLWVWILVDCISKEPSQGNGKVVWILVIIFIPWMGALLYLLARRPQRMRMLGK